MFLERTTQFLERAGLLTIAVILSPSAALADTGDDDSDDLDPLAGRTVEQLDALMRDFDEVVETVVFYASLASVLVILLALALALRLKHWAAYIGLTIACLVWFAFFEQRAAGLPWIGVEIGQNGLVLSGFVLASLHALLAGASISPGKPLARLRPYLFALSALFWVVLAIAWPPTSFQTPLAFYGVALIACFSHLAAVPSFQRKQGPTVRVERVGLAFVTIAALAALGAALFGEIDEDFDLIFLARLALVAVVAFFVLFFARHVLTILRDRDARIMASLEDARRDAEKSRALLEAEQKYSRARDAARRHTMRLATASHDVRQPIASLRTTLGAVAKDQPQDVRDQLDAAFDYLDQLAQSYMDTGEADNAPSRPDDPSAPGDEIVSSDVICATIDRMFRAEAEAKGLKFEVEAQSRSLRIPPLAVNRVLCNFLANAIAHTDSGTVCLSATDENESFRFSVFNTAQMPDGPQAEALFDPHVKGARSTGAGLGLSIVETLLATDDLRVTWSSPPGEGTTFSLIVSGSRVGGAA